MSGTKRFLALTLVVLSATPATLMAQSQGGSFRLWQHGARELAMGGASHLLAPGLESLFGQPASLVGMDGWEMGASVQKPADGVELTLSSFALGLSSGHRDPMLSERTATSSRAAAIAFQHLGATLADDSGWGEWTLAAAAAWSPKRWFSLGARGSYARGGSEDGVDEGSAVALSTGLRTVLFDPRLELGWLAQDIHHSYSRDQGPDQRRAATQTFSLAARLPRAISAEIQTRWRAGDMDRYALGAEWVPWAERLTLRGGLLFLRQVESRMSPSAGFGIHHRGFRLDYGFRFEGEEGPGALHRLSLLWTGGRS